MVPAVRTARAGEGADPLPGRRHRVEVLLRALVVAAAAGGVAVALLLDPVALGSGRLSFGGFTLPGLCAFYELTGIPCPGCGLTRSWVAAVHGGLGGSFAHHPLGWLVLLYVLAQGFRHAAWLALPARRSGVERLGRRLDRGLVVLGVLLVLTWVPRVLLVLRDRL